MSPLMIGLTLVGLVGAGLLLWLEYEAYMRHTSVQKLPNGLKFKSQFFELTVDHEAQSLTLKAKQGRLQHTGADGQTLASRSGPIECGFAAIGFRLEVAKLVYQEGESDGDPPAAGLCQVNLTAQDTPHLDTEGPVPPTTLLEVHLALMPHQVGTDLLSFYSGVRRWVAKLEEHQGAELATARVAAAKEERKRLEQEARERSRAKKAEISKAQIEHWRQVAGFTGEHSALGTTGSGAIEWYIETTTDGRAIIHSEGKTFIGSLAGGSATVIDDHLEVKVRDEYWDPIASPALSRLAVLTLENTDVLRQWRDRIEQLSAAAKPGTKPISTADIQAKPA